jgi:hypothetical protein
MMSSTARPASPLTPRFGFGSRSVERIAWALQFAADCWAGPAADTHLRHVPPPQARVSCAADHDAHPGTNSPSKWDRLMASRETSSSANPAGHF